MDHAAPPTRRALLALLTVLAVTAGLLAGAPPRTAVAAPVVGFQAGNIISDANFYDVATMSVAQVQTFLVERGASCRQATGGPACLKDYRQSTVTRAATAQCPGAYTGAASEPASTIVYKVARACGINPRVLLVMLQKEQGLVTSSAPRASSYTSAMGQGCPDTAACDTQYSGFYNQVYGAASQLQRYRLSPNSYAYRPFLTNTILYNPNRACGSSAVYLANQATAALYNYTPYQPNQAALNAGYGTGDSCSAYGNRNFYSYYLAWFGTPTAPNRAPKGAVDSAVSTSSTTVALRGWAFDPDTTAPIRVHAYVDGRGTALTADGPRPDVGRVYPGAGDNHGYSITITVSPTAQHTVCLYAIDTTGGPATTLTCRTIPGIVNRPPVGAVDSVVLTSPTTVAVRGWAFDRDTTAPIRVHVYADGVGTALTADRSRPDVGRVYPGVGDNRGYSATVTVTPAAQHRVCLYAIDSAGGPATGLVCRTVAG